MPTFNLHHLLWLLKGINKRINNRGTNYEGILKEYVRTKCKHFSNKKKKKKESILHYILFIKWNTSITIANNNKINKYKIESYISYNVKILKHAYNFHFGIFFFLKTLFFQNILIHISESLLRKKYYYPLQIGLEPVFRWNIKEKRREKGREE